MSQHACNEPSFVWWGGTVTWPWTECALRSLSWVVTCLSRSITAFHLFPLHTGMWETTQDGRISGLWQCNSFSLLKAKWPHALGLPRPGHAQLTYAGFWLLQWLDGVLPTFTCIYAADVQRPGWRPPAMHGIVLHKKTVSTRVSHSDQLTGGKSHFNMF